MTLAFSDFFVLFLGTALILFRRRVAEGQVKITVGTFGRRLGSLKSLLRLHRITNVIVGVLFIVSIVLRRIWT